jgi:hypothetical protein
MPFTWDAKTHSYRTPAGRKVPQVAIRAKLDAAVERTKGDLRKLTQRYINGKVNSSEWFLGVDKLLTQMHSGAAQIAVGGKGQMLKSPVFLGRLGARVREQKAYLRGLEREVYEGKQKLDGRLLARIEMFGDAGVGTYENMRRGMMMGDRGIAEESRRLGYAKHCGDCPPLAGYWAPIGTLPEIGASQCLSRCHCRFIYR